MVETGRNAPCPCGSGRKYKKCCLPEEHEFAARRREEGQAVGAALSWLSEHYPEEVEEAIHRDFFGGLEDDEVEALEELEPGLREMLNVNIGEWLLSDAEFEVGGKGCPHAISCSPPADRS